MNKWIKWKVQGGGYKIICLDDVREVLCCAVNKMFWEVRICYFNTDQVSRIQVLEVHKNELMAEIEKQLFER